MPEHGGMDIWSEYAMVVGILAHMLEGAWTFDNGLSKVVVSVVLQGICASTM